MSDIPFTENGFLKQVTTLIDDNISNEKFGVSELAQEIGMSRSTLLRKVKKLSGVSVAQFIRNVRLQRAMDLLKKNDMTVSEISYQVGFNSTSYFIKCFREYYGYPPGEAEKRDFDDSDAREPALPRQLAAIMFTDIKDYTAFMQQDEEKALQFRNRHREVFNSVTKKFNGKILQYYGDGTLSIFQSAIDAVKCGIELQLAFKQAPSIPVRIGIHSGDIIFSKEEIIGDGVNVASRIESLAVAGSVFISDKVFDEVKNQSGIQTASMGLFEFKNVDKSIEVYAITNPGLIIPQKGQLTGKVKQPAIPKKAHQVLKWAMILLAVFAAGYLFNKTEIPKKPAEVRSPSDMSISQKSIAVLPFINDSNDSTNVYIINGVMESILNHLQKIADLRVISRTSVEKYRNTTKLIPDIAEELGVSFFVEGSGQKIGDQILLNIQLIDASSDQHLWAEQYQRSTEDIFTLQQEVAKKIAGEIKVIITPEEAERLDEIPTENMKAYDAYLKGRDLFYKGSGEGLMEAISSYEEAARLDPEFAHAYAGLAIAYYFLGFQQPGKSYSDEINNYADKALLYDAQLPQSLIAKALYYLNKNEHEAALPHLEKALEYNPNSALVINILSDYYARYVPNTEKYLEYALKGINLDIASHDSTTASFIYLHISNAFIQSGFVEQAERYINKSLAYDAENLYSQYVKAFILYAKEGDLAKTRALLLETLDQDTTRLDVMQEVAKISYFMRDYRNAYNHYKKFTTSREALNLDIYQSENLKIAMVMKAMGRDEEAEKHFEKFKAYSEADNSIYKSINLAMVAAFKGDNKEAILQLQEFSKEENYHYWILVFFESDPVMHELKDLRAFKAIMKKLETKFWDRHKHIKTALKEQNLI